MDKENQKNIKFKYYSAKEDKHFLFESFRLVFNKAFDQWYPMKTFNWKYLSKFSIDSVIQEISIEDEIVGYRGLWKVNEYAYGYQCIDTCIDPNYQGKGIFKKSNQHLIKTLGSIYNYPNPKSYPGYLKSGWKNHGAMNIYINKISNFEFCDWSEDFIDWRFCQHPYIKYYKIKLTSGFAVIRYKKNLPVHVESVKHDLNLEQVKSPFFSFKYALKPSGFRIRNAGMVVVNNFSDPIRSSYFDMI